jgi:hypothetical protein
MVLNPSERDPSSAQKSLSQHFLVKNSPVNSLGGRRSYVSSVEQLRWSSEAMSFIDGSVVELPVLKVKR